MARHIYLVFPLLVILAQTLQPTTGRADDWWSRAKVAKTRHYALKTDLPRAQAVQLAKHMDGTFDAYVRTFSKLPVRMRKPAALGLFLFAEQKDYITTLPIRFRTDGTGSWGMCISRGDTISLVGYRGHHTVEQMKPLLQHEGFHQFARHLFPDLPPWANEGLAEVFERGVAVGDDLLLGDIPKSDRRRLLQAIESGTVMPISKLLRVDSREWKKHVVSGDAGLQYVQAWSLVQYFLFAEGGRHQKTFLGFLVGLNADVDWERSFVATFGWVDWNQLQRRWESYVKDAEATDLRRDVREAEYLAAGMLELRTLGVFPSTTGELREALIQQDFRRTRNMYGEEVTVTPNNALMRRLAASPGDAENPLVLLEFSDSRGRKPSSSYSKKKLPRPLNVTIQGLQPRDLAIRWQRDGKKYKYQIGGKSK